MSDWSPEYAPKRTSADHTEFMGSRPSRAKAVLRPYSAELGYLAIAWNQLRCHLMALFAMLSEPQDSTSAKAVLYFLGNDFSQRRLLRALLDIDANKLPPAVRKLSTTQTKEILWLLNQIDEGFRHKRNNALHAPLMVMQGVYDDAVREWGRSRHGLAKPREPNLCVIKT